MRPELRGAAVDRRMLWGIVLVSAAALSPLVLAPLTMRFGEGTVFFGQPYAVMKQILLTFHRLPLWDPYLGGDSIVGSPQAGIFYPPAWLMLVTPTVLAGLRLVVYLHLLAAAVGGYRLARWLGCPPLASLLAPVGLLFNARVLHFIHGGGMPELYALPWAIWGIACFWRGTAERRAGFLVLASGCLASQVLAGTTYLMHVTVLAYGVILAGTALTGPDAWGRRLVLMTRQGVTVAAASAGLAALKLLPVLESTLISTRAGWTIHDLETTGQNPSWVELGRTFTTWFGQTPAIWSPWVHGIYLGLAAIACAAALRVRNTAEWQAQATFALMALIACWVGMGPAVPVDLFAGLYYLLPGFRYSNYTGRVLFMLRLALPVLAALGAAQVRRILAGPRARRLGLARGVLTAGVILCAAAPIGPFYRALRSHAFGRVHPVPTAVASAPAPSLEAALARYDAQSGRDDWNDRLAIVAHWTPQPPFRIYSDGGRLPSVTRYDAFLNGVEMAMPLDPAYLPRYGLIIHYLDPQGPVEMARLFTLFRLMNVRYLLTASDHAIGALGQTRLVYARPDAELYELTTTLPRVWIPDDALLLAGDANDPDYNAQDARLIAYRPGFDPARRVVFRAPLPYLDQLTADELAPFRAVLLARPRIQEPEAAQRLLAAYQEGRGQILPFFTAGFRYTNPYFTANSLLDGVLPARVLSPDTASRLDAILRGPAEAAVAQATVTVERVWPGRWRLRVETARAVTPVVISETYFPGWRARVDGRPVPVYMADGLIKGVLVRGPGRHLVELWYAPRTLWLGAAVTAITVVIIGVWWLWRRRRASCTS